MKLDILSALKGEAMWKASGPHGSRRALPGALMRINGSPHPEERRSRVSKDEAPGLHMIAKRLSNGP